MTQYVRLALGITDANANYSAAEHNLGPKILSESTPERVFELAQALDACKKKSHVPDIIYRHGILYLKISVGSEMAMMLRPDDFWVGNVRTIWAHLLLKHKWNYDRANEELELYKDSDRDSEMDYRVWRDLYLATESSLATLVSLSNIEAQRQSVVPGRYKFLWADAIANGLYETRT